MRKKKKSILLTFDVEDWFQVENFKGVIKYSAWNFFELRVEKNTYKILNLLDTFSFKPKATFFILGWIAKRCPDLVKEIHNRGHEVGSHGFDHHLCANLKPDKLLSDLNNSKKLLEDLTGTPITGYRAPSFAVNDGILNTIHNAGYKYDSSYNSFSGHGRYGTIDLSGAQQTGSVYKLEDNFYEIPISNLKLFSKIVPLGGGGYFRLIPFPIFTRGIKKILNKKDAFVFYSHPWEFDPDQPRVEQAPKSFKFRHYINLRKTEQKLKALITTFKDCQFITCNHYLDDLNKSQPFVT